MKEAARTVGEARRAILLAFGLFCLGVVGGAGPVRLPTEFLRSLAGDRQAPWFVEALTIFAHNAALSFFEMRIVVLWGAIAAAACVGNGVVLGSALGATHYRATVLLELAPHELFEVSACVIGWGLGLWQGAAWRGWRTDEERRRRQKASDRVFVWLVVPLLLVAAFVEARPE